MGLKLCAYDKSYRKKLFPYQKVVSVKRLELKKICFTQFHTQTHIYTCIKNKVTEYF